MTFTPVLQVTHARWQEVTDLEYIPAQRGRTGEPARVLVLEPDRPLRTLLAEWVEMAGYRFVEGHIADPATNAVAPCEVILIDVRAPLRSARLAISSMAAALPHASVVAMSADALATGQRATEAVARELRVAAVLVKPFGRDELTRAIERALATMRGSCNVIRP